MLATSEDLKLFTLAKAQAEKITAGSFILGFAEIPTFLCSGASPSQKVEKRSLRRQISKALPFGSSDALRVLYLSAMPPASMFYQTLNTPTDHLIALPGEMKRICPSNCFGRSLKRGASVSWLSATKIQPTLRMNTP